MGMRKHGQHPGHIVGPDGSVLYVHIPRTGGQSICMVFNCADGHLSIAHSKAMMKEKFDGCKVISVVRNPWDHAVSFYVHSRGYGSENHHDLDIKRFREWVAAGCPKRTVTQYGVTTDCLDQLAYLTGGTFNAFKFPHGITEAIAAIADATGLPKKDTPRIGHKDHLPYPAYYDDVSITTIADMRRREIVLFGWKFGE